MTVEISFFGSAAGVREEMSALLGQTAIYPSAVGPATTTKQAVGGSDLSELLPDSKPPVADTIEADDSDAEPVFRGFEEKSPGKGRRLKAEIEEDEKVTALVAEAGASMDNVKIALTERGHAAVIAELEAHLAKAATSDEDQTADKADEAAETADADADTPVPTVDGVRSLMGEYRDKHGMPATQEDGPVILNDAVGAPPGGEAHWKVSMLGEAAPEVLAAAYKAWADAVTANGRYKTPELD